MKARYTILSLIIFLAISASCQIEVNADRYRLNIKNKFKHTITIEVRKKNKVIVNNNFLGFEQEYELCGNRSRSDYKNMLVIPTYTRKNFENDKRIIDINHDNAINNLNKQIDYYTQDNLNKGLAYVAIASGTSLASEYNNWFTNFLSGLGDLGLAMTDTYIAFESIVDGGIGLNDVLTNSNNTTSFKENINKYLSEALEDKIIDEVGVAAFKSMINEIGIKDGYSERIGKHIVYRIRNHLKLLKTKTDTGKRIELSRSNQTNTLSSILNDNSFSSRNTIDVFEKDAKKFGRFKRITPNATLYAMPYLITSDYNENIARRSDPLFIRDGDSYEWGDGFINNTYIGELDIALTNEFFIKNNSCRIGTIHRFYISVGATSRDYNLVNLSSVNNELLTGTKGVIHKYEGDIIFNHLQLGAGLKYKIFFKNVLLEFGSRYTREEGKLNFKNAKFENANTSWVNKYLRVTNEAYTPIYTFGMQYTKSIMSIGFTGNAYYSKLSNKDINTFSVDNKPIQYGSNKFIWNIGLGLISHF